MNEMNRGGMDWGEGTKKPNQRIDDKETVRKSLKRSSEAFINLVWPVITNVCGGGRLVPIETIFDSEIANSLDMLCGIDFLHLADEGARGIATRVQHGNDTYGDVNWHTFTIRASRGGSDQETELGKRIRAINSRGRWMYPYLTCQAYVSQDGTRLVGGGLALTANIFKAIADGKYKERTYDNAVFYAIKFNDVECCYTF